VGDGLSSRSNIVELIGTFVSRRYFTRLRNIYRLIGFFDAGCRGFTGDKDGLLRFRFRARDSESGTHSDGGHKNATAVHGG
jgi:hypothetical protein